ncbi:MAG: Metalloprotease MmpA [Alphaproteobacteria bacterium MarineAlpha8_Bin1]|nr:MAG: Metalloprotease MmpA [Alphaproteobacteria bacterium MarineAlpha8_Bin1]|tara:strand:- start:835 stop:1884 length:1050 start_codon:yes stop_codon:yes gene_type:complete
MITSFINNILPFLVILTVLVFVHELGHYLIARLNGVKVEVFSIGFGKELFGFDDNLGTRWKFSLIPLGGYVKMHGDLDAASTKISDDDSINPKESFYNKSVSQRSWILFAGPAANFIFSFLILVFINIFYGFSENKPVISEIEPNKPAYLAGLKVGDLILEVNKSKVNDLISLKNIISKNNNKQVEIILSRNDKIQIFNVLVEDNRIGIKGTVEVKKLNFIDSVYKSSYQIYYFIKITLIGIYEIFSGTRGTDDLGGPIRIAELSADFWSQGIQSTLWFMMIISLNLGLINLFPIPMLDGGHLVLNLIEFVKGSPLNKKSLEIVHSIGFAILVSLMIFATYNDISRFFG